MARRRLDLSSPRSIRKSAQRVANLLLNEELGAKAGQAIASLCKICLESIRTDEQEKRLNELEKAVEEMREHGHDKF